MFLIKISSASKGIRDILLPNTNNESKWKIAVLKLPSIHFRLCKLRIGRHEHDFDNMHKADYNEKYINSVAQKFAHVTRQSNFFTARQLSIRLLCVLLYNYWTTQNIIKPSLLSLTTENKSSYFRVKLKLNLSCKLNLIWAVNWTWT